jgi:hypothetical protein
MAQKNPTFQCKNMSKGDEIYFPKRELGQKRLQRILSSGIQKPTSDSTGNTLRLRYRAQLVNAKHDLRASRRRL